MASTIEAPVPAVSPAPPRPTVSRKRRYTWLWVIAVCLPLIYVGIILWNWPLTEKSLTQALEDRSLREVQIGRFSRTFFPPGCVAEDIKFLHRKHKEKEPLIRVQRLEFVTSYSNILTLQDRLTNVHVIHMHVTVPPTAPGQPNPVMPLTYSKGAQSSVRVDTLIADDAVLDFITNDGKPRYHLQIEHLHLYNVGNNRPINYQTVITNQVPPGTIRSSGVFGTWNPKDPGTTPVHGTYSFDHANLAVFGGISGTLGASGKFTGNLNTLAVEGTADVPNFKVHSANHQRDLSAAYHATVDATNGDVALNHVSANFDNTTVECTGSVTGQNTSSGKTAKLDLWTKNARVDDVLRLFISAPLAPMTGTFDFHGHVELPPGPPSFVERIRMDGDFGVDAGKFRNAQAEQDLTRLSESAAKHHKTDEPVPAGDVLSELRGHGSANHGMATLSNLGFRIPGAQATLHGTYSLENYKVDLHGKLVTTGSPSQATTGMRSFMLKLITPMFKKKHSVDVVPFKITGSSSDLNVALDMGQGKQQ